MNIKAVVFDLDGTIVQYCIDIEAERKELANVVREEGLKLDPTKLPIYLMLKRAERSLDRERFIKFKEKVYEVVRKYELKAAEKAELVDGVMELISWLRGNGVKLAILTNNSSESLKVLDARLGIRKYFDVVTTRDDVDRLKPEPEGLILTLSKLGTKDAIMVGDSPADVLVSRRAGVLCVGVASTNHYRESLILSGPDFLVDEVRLVKDVIMHLQC